MKMILPKEHGSWSLALEPIALGLLVAPSIAGGTLAIAAVAGFFLRRPLKILFRERDNDERRKIAIADIFILSAIALAGFLLTAKIAGIEKLWPLIPSALAGFAFALFDSRNEGREGAAEISGALAFGILPAAFATLAGWNFTAAISLAVVMLARSIPTVLFVRTFLRIKKGRAATMAPTIVAAVIAFLLAASLAMLKTIPWLVTVFALAMTARTIFILVVRPNFSAKAIGIS